MQSNFFFKKQLCILTWQGLTISMDIGVKKIIIFFFVHASYIIFTVNILNTGFDFLHILYQCWTGNTFLPFWLWFMQCLKGQSGTSSASCSSFIFVSTYLLLGHGKRKKSLYHYLGKISVKDAEMSQTSKDYSQPEGKAKSLLVSL